ncbi:MAG: hypothetical protein R3B70_38915 [Polyangiaceae bacterium]
MPYGRLIRAYQATEGRRSPAEWSHQVTACLRETPIDPGSAATLFVVARALQSPAMAPLEDRCRAHGLAPGPCVEETRRPPAPEAGLRVFLAVGPLIWTFLQGLAIAAIAWLEARNYTVLCDPATDGAGAHLLEHGLWPEYVEAVARFHRALAAHSPLDRVIVLDPLVLQTLIDHGQWTGLEVPCPVVPFWETLGELPAAGWPEGDSVLLDVTPTTRAATPALARWLERAGATVTPIPESLRVGAPLAIHERALGVIFRLTRAKAEWLSTQQDPLITADPLTLLREKKARHLLGAFGIEGGS